MEPWKSVGKEEETKGNREGWSVIISPQLSPGYLQQWVASLWLLLLSAGGRVEASLQERLLPLASLLMPVDPGTRKGPSKEFFFHSCPDSVSFLFCYTMECSLGPLNWRYVSIPLEELSLGIGLEGIEERNPAILPCAASQPTLTNTAAKNKHGSTKN